MPSLSFSSYALGGCNKKVYDEDGELVGTYTAAEFDALKRSQHGR